MIDSNTGKISFDSGFSVWKDMTIDDLVKRTGSKCERTLRNGRYETYLIRNLCLSGESVSLSIHFRDNRVLLLRIAVDSGLKSWADYSPAGEKQSKDRHDRLLASLLNGVGQTTFRWGHVESSCDAKTGDACIVVSYVA